MSQDRTPGPDPAGRAPEPEAALNDALDDLEAILARRRVGAEGTDPDAAPGRADPIPLLEEMVVPGPGVASPPAEPLGEAERLRRRIVERLASEIEVIVQSRIETALAEASERIRRDVRNHVSIILPEILDELGTPPPTED